MLNAGNTGCPPKKIDPKSSMTSSFQVVIGDLVSSAAWGTRRIL